jgi:hypothetical protein
MSEESEVEEGSTVGSVLLVDKRSVAEDCEADTGWPDVVSENDEGWATEKVSLEEGTAVG